MLAPGTQLGGYRIEGLLGRGGMGVVYEATQLSLHRRVALKLLSADLSGDPSFRARFQREGRLHAAIDHAHIVPIYDSGDLGDEGLFIAMRVVRGPNLKELITSGTLDPQRALRILGPVADALDTAHEGRLVHRDIKPQNILVGPRDHGYLADFGLTRTPGDTAFTKTGQFVGTLDYIAPEQIRGERPGPPSDIYSFAAVVYECMTGSVPFVRPTEAAVLFAHVSDDVPLASGHVAALAPIDEILARAMAKAPADRPASVTAFVQELAVALQETAARPPSPSANDRDGAERLAATAVTPEVAERELADTAVDEAVPEPATVASNTVQLSAQHSRWDLPTVTDPRPEPRAVAPAAPARTEEAPAFKPAQTARPRFGAATIAASVGVLASCAALGVLAAGGGDSAAADRTAIRAGGITMQAPSQWVATSKSAELPGLSLRRARAYAAKPGAPAGIVVGMTDATGATLLPRAFRRTLPGDPAGRPVRLGRLEALRYENLRPRNANRSVTLLASPTMTGVATVACLGDAAQRAICEAATNSVRADEGVTPLRLEPRAGYAKAASAILERLASRRARDVNAFRGAGTRGRQAAHARRLSQHYAAAGRAFAALPAGPRERPAQDRVSAALTRVAASLRDLSSAASRGRTRTYAAARLSVRRRENAVRRAVRLLDGVGYRSG